MPRPIMPMLMSFNGGFVDTAGFLALQGLFTAHVTGNFVTIGAAATFGTSGIIAKLLALPVFCLAIFLARLATARPALPDAARLTMLLAGEFILLTVGGIAVAMLYPFPPGDSLSLVLSGMTLVAAMALQNIAHRAHLSRFPPSTLMTGTTTQIMLEIADFVRGSAEARQAIRTRIGPLITSLAAFALGCLAGAVLFMLVKGMSLLLPPFVAAVILARVRTEVAPAR